MAIMAEKISAMLYGGESVLRGAAEVWINGDVPHIKQPFWDVEPVPVPLAPTAQFIR